MSKVYTKYPMSDKIKVAVYLDPELDNFLEENKGEELKKSQYIRTILRQEMRKKQKKIKPTTNDVGNTYKYIRFNDPYSFPNISEKLVPDDLKQYSELLMEWWPIRKKKGGTCSTRVAERIFKKLRAYPSKDAKLALENAIAGGWKDLFPVSQSKIVEEPKNNHPASRVFTAKGGFE